MITSLRQINAVMNIGIVFNILLGHFKDAVESSVLFGAVIRFMEADQYFRTFYKP